jgi:hypothetical protein
MNDLILSPPFWIEAVQPGCPPWTPRGHPRMAKRAPHKNPKIYQTCTRGAFGVGVSILGVHKAAARTGGSSSRSGQRAFPDRKTDQQFSFQVPVLPPGADLTPDRMWRGASHPSSSWPDRIR